MESHTFDRHLAGEVAIDLCFPCRLIWFDSTESLQLSPAGVLDLFKLIHRHEKTERWPLADRFSCPRCRVGLRRTEDMSKGGRFRYFRCENDHGRLTPFFDFLREKQFVRALTPGEIARIRASIRQVRCSGCGAPIDLRRDTRCSHCAAPIAILDPDAVENAVRMWSGRAATIASHDPSVGATAVERLRASERTLSRRGNGVGAAALEGIDSGSDLVDFCIHMLGGLFE